MLTLNLLLVGLVKNWQVCKMRCKQQMRMDKATMPIFRYLNVEWDAHCWDTTNRWAWMGREGTLWMPIQMLSHGGLWYTLVCPWWTMVYHGIPMVDHGIPCYTLVYPWWRCDQWMGREGTLWMRAMNMETRPRRRPRPHCHPPLIWKSKFLKVLKLQAI